MSMSRCNYALFGNALSSHTEFTESEYQATAEDVQRPAGEETNRQKHSSSTALIYCNTVML